MDLRDEPKDKLLKSLIKKAAILTELTPQMRNQIKRGYYSALMQNIEGCYELQGKQRKLCIVKGIHSNCLSQFDVAMECLNKKSDIQCHDLAVDYIYCFYDKAESLRLSTFTDI